MELRIHCTNQERGVFLGIIVVALIQTLRGIAILLFTPLGAMGSGRIQDTPQNEHLFVTHPHQRSQHKAPDHLL
jgi:hypothetical protein